MTLDLNNLSFGQYLKTIRLKRGIELEVISKETRIGMANLRHIESEAHDLLPAVAFVKGFLRAYAQALGVDGEDVVRRRTVRDKTKTGSIMMALDQVPDHLLAVLRFCLPHADDKETRELLFPPVLDPDGHATFFGFA